MANNFYLQPINNLGLLYELHATTDVKVSYPSSVTTYPIETGSDVSDNIVIGGAIISFTGVLTEVKQAAGLLSLTSLAVEAFTGNVPDYQAQPHEYINELRQRQRNKELFFVFFSGSETQNANDLEGIEIAVLTNLEISKTTNQGTSWSVDVTLQEVRLASQAILEAQPSADWSELTAKNKQGAGNTAGTTPKEQDVILEGGTTIHNVTKKTVRLK